jgi:hypothetical protein
MIDYPPPRLESASTRYVAIGASHLNGSTCPGDLKDENGNQVTGDKRYNYLAGYRSQVPEAVFGKTIYLYRRKN